MVPRSKVLITGASGLLGAHLVAALSGRYEVVGIDRHPWWGDQPANVLVGDLSAADWVSETLGRIAPDIVMHCAALVDVEACEQDPAAAYAVNAQMTRAVARAVRPGCLFVYITTDSVFQGDAPNATEEEPPCPMSVYARSKLHGEWEVALATPNHLIVRTNFYGWSSGRKETAAEWLYRALETGQEITLFTDVFFTPIYVMDLVERLERLIERDDRGMIHLGGRSRVSKHRFGALLAELAGFSMDHVRQGTLDASNLRAPRPKDMSLSSDRFCRLTGLEVPAVRAGLLRFLADRDRPLSARCGARRARVAVPAR